MASAYEIANYLVYLTSDVFDDLSNMKINKLLYYAQGHCLKETGKPLFGDPIEAWAHGPIVNDVYQRYKSYGDSPISNYDKNLLDRVTEQEKDLLMKVARQYGVYTASALRCMTHYQKSPWDQVYDARLMHNEIPVSLIKDYFIKYEEALRPIEISIELDDIIGYRDENGILVLPKDWNDEEV